MRGRLTVICLAVALAVMLVAADSGGACVCAFGVTPKGKLKAANGAVTARLLSVRTSEDKRHAALRYRVGRVFKGGRRLHRGQVVTAWDDYAGTDCQVPENTGEVYGLFLSRENGRWTVGFCGVVSPKTMRRAARHDAGSSASSGSGCSG